MNKPTLATFKYEHDDPMTMLAVHQFMLLLIALLAISAFFAAGPAGIVILFVFVIYAVKVWPKRRILLGPRYLLRGKTILYYANVRKMILAPDKGQLSLFYGNGKLLQLDQSKFPTGARKPDKIEKNKKAKFQKVSGKIIQRVLTAAPDVELIGIDRDAAMQG